ncbi:MAG: DUF2156 domain-containing protein [Candidatus Aminicenantales bacterium]
MSSLPAFKWKPLELGHLDELKKFLELRLHEVSELALANLYLWQEFDRPCLARQGENLVLRLSPPNEPPYILEPLGPPPSPKLVEACLLEVGRLSRLPASFLPVIPSRGVIVKENRDQFDYLYRREDLALLRGKKFDGKRNLVRRFQKTYPEYEFLVVGKEMKSEAMAFFRDWVAAKSMESLRQPLGLENQARALEKSFELWERLSLRGGMLVASREKKAIKGLIIASPLNKETAVVHFQYADPKTPGASQTLLWAACNSLLLPFSLVNLEQDLGVAGIRKAKLAYHPCRLVAKYDVERG